MKLSTVYGSTPAAKGLEEMARMIGCDFWCGSSCDLREEVTGKVWSVWSHGNTKKSALVVVRKGGRLQFGPVAA